MPSNDMFEVFKRLGEAGHRFLDETHRPLTWPHESPCEDAGCLCSAYRPLFLRKAD